MLILPNIEQYNEIIVKFNITFGFDYEKNLNIEKQFQFHPKFHYFCGHSSLFGQFPTFPKEISHFSPQKFSTFLTEILFFFPTEILFFSPQKFPTFPTEISHIFLHINFPLFPQKLTTFPTEIFHFSPQKFPTFPHRNFPQRFPFLV